MDARGGQHGIKKRTPNACRSCRRDKVKCSGSAPCLNCSRKRKTCLFDNAENSVLVPRRYLSDLEGRLAALEETSDEFARRSPQSTLARVANTEESVGVGDAAITSRHCHPSSTPRPTGTPDRGRPATSTNSQEPRLTGENEASRRSSPEAEAMTNPLSAGPTDSGFISDIAKGRSIYLGTSSNWSFTRRVLDAAHQATKGAPLSPNNFALDGDVYSLGWDGSRIPADSDKKVALPSLSHALYLARSAQFHIGEVYHLFYEETFISELQTFYSNPADHAQKQTLWYCHFLLVMACGKAAISQGIERGKPQGIEFFVQAMKLLPDVSRLWIYPFTSAEIFCCVALYLQSADYRYGAYLMIGHAVRTALFQGMHTDMPTGIFGTFQVERARHIWWSVYVLDHQLSSLMGLPTQISDDSITASLPTFQTPEQASFLRIHIKLCRIVAQVVSTVYGVDGRLDTRFLTSTKTILKSMADIAEELSTSFPLSLDDPNEGISRPVATLHLQYHQCIVLTTRPLLFSLFKKRLDAQSTSPNLDSTMRRLRVLLQMCADSSEHSLNILSALQSQDLLATFIVSDLEAAFCSGMITLMASFVDLSLTNNLKSQLEIVHSTLDYLIIKGNAIASLRKAEIEQLDSMISSAKLQDRILPAGPHRLRENPATNLPTPNSTSSKHIGVGIQADPTGQYTSDVPLEDWTWEDALDSTQLMNVADLLDVDKFDGFSASFNF